MLLFGDKLMRVSPETFNTRFTATYDAYDGISGGTFHDDAVRELQTIWRAFESARTPNFFNWKGRLPYNSYYMQLIKRKFNRIHEHAVVVASSNPLDVGSYSDYYDVRGFILSYPDYATSVSHDIGVYNRILNLMIDRISDQKANINVNVAERQQAANMVEGTVLKLVNTIEMLKSRRYNDAWRYLLGTNRPSRANRFRGPFEEWLAMQYGWKPLLSDIKGTLEALAEHLYFHPPIVESTAKASSGGVRYSFNDTLQGHGVTTSFVQGNSSTKGRGHLRFSLPNPNLRRANQLGILNPFELAWELLPWSFVADWFIPVGAYLRNLTYNIGLSFEGGFITLVSSSQWDVKVSGGQTEVASGRAIEFTYDSVISESVQNTLFNRYAFTSVPMPPFPAFKDPFSPLHAANALALLSLRLR